MKIATWNLERPAPQSVKADRQRRWLTRIDADLWILTETHLDLAPGVGYAQVASGQPDRPGEEGERWVQIWAKEGHLTPLETSDTARTAAALWTPAAGQPWVVYGTVLPWLGSSWRTYPAAEGAAFAAALAVQQADWQRLRAEHPTAPLLVAGDFNQDLNTLQYYGSRRNKAALRAALGAVGLDCLTAGEHDPIHRLIDGQHSNLDHICLTRDSLTRGSLTRDDLARETLTGDQPPGDRATGDRPTEDGATARFQGSFAWPPRLEDLRGLSDHFGVGVEVDMGYGLAG